jgi:hypothetical protein
MGSGSSGADTISSLRRAIVMTTEPGSRLLSEEDQECS